MSVGSSACRPVVCRRHTPRLRCSCCRCESPSAAAASTAATTLSTSLLAVEGHQGLSRQQSSRLHPSTTAPPYYILDEDQPASEPVNHLIWHPASSGASLHVLRHTMFWKHLGSPRHLASCTWHFCNRHVPTLTVSVAASTASGATVIGAHANAAAAAATAIRLRP
jgi:hypothetical protein